MNKQITIEEVFDLVEFRYVIGRGWEVESVEGDVLESVGGGIGGSVAGSIGGSVGFDVIGDVGGHILGSVGGSVCGTIDGCQWKYVETPRQKVARLIKETGHVELLEAFNQLEDNS